MQMLAESQCSISILMLTTLHFKAVTMSLQCPSRATHRYRPSLCCKPYQRQFFFSDGIGWSFTLAGPTESNVARPIFVPQLQVGYSFPWSTHPNPPAKSHHECTLTRNPALQLQSSPVDTCQSPSAPPRLKSILDLCNGVQKRAYRLWSTCANEY